MPGPQLTRKRACCGKRAKPHRPSLALGHLPTAWGGSLRPAGEATTNKRVRTIRFFGSFFAKKEPKKRMVRTRLFVVASPAGRKEPPHAVGRWPSASDGRWGFARFPQHARLRVSCGPGMPGPYGRWPGVELLPGRADMESAPTEGIGRKGNNNEVPRASNARPYTVLQFIKTKRDCCTSFWMEVQNRP